MPRWLEILLTLILFAVAMSALSWGVNAVVPGLADWTWDRIGGPAAWGILIVVLLGLALYAYRSHRRAGM